MEHPSIFVFITYVFTGVWFVSTSGNILASRHLNKFRGICLYFSTVLTTTTFVAVVSHQMKAFDVHGDPQNAFETAILYTYNSMVDFRLEVFNLLSILYLFVSPVLLTYTILGLFGYASWINVIGPVLTLIVYSALKFIICAMAVLMIVAPWGYWEGWFQDKISLDIMLFSEVLAVNAIGVSQLVLIFYLEARSILTWFGRWVPEPLMGLLRRVHEWFSRKSVPRAAS